MNLVELVMIMVSTAKEILFSRIFQGQDYNFPGQRIQDLKVIIQDIRAKKLFIFVQCMIDYGHFYGTSSSTPSICLIQTWGQFQFRFINHKTNFLNSNSVINLLLFTLTSLYSK